MKWTGLNELREVYLNFFEQKNHLRAKSYPLVPQNDNSLLLIGAGMAPLKPYFTGQEIPPRRRMTTCQKCIRTGDVENVGKTARHGTFFEMLGNFSFGDYFKEDAIQWAWEFVTKVLEIPEERLYVTVYEEDDEAEAIWHEKVGLPMEKIFRLGREDNFWEAGIDGPCGPCSEIFFDRGEEFGCGKPDCSIGCDCDRYMEFWNLVFTQFERHEDGTYTPLKQKNIDTGMGLERIAALMQGVDSIFDVDTVKAIRDHVCRIAGVEYGKDPKKDVSIRVITDHIRSVTFMASDGVLPSNEGRGYVMRRLLRRAARHGKLLGIHGLFLKDLLKTVVDCSKDAYSELEEKYDYIVKLLTNEEKNFNETIDRGMNILNGYIEKMQAENKTILDGGACFVLQDTYGFPLDLTREILEEKGCSCDEEGFAAAMEEQREKARAARGDSKYMGAEQTVYHQISKEYETIFTGYNTLKSEGRIDYLVKDDAFAENAGCGDEVCIVTAVTPFYAESGGQAGDTGVMITASGKCAVYDTVKAVGGKIVHKARVTEGAVAVGQTVKLIVDREKRLATMRNHSCAHLLQAALRTVLGDHVHQAGQLVDSQRLRFDFAHFSAMTAEELAQVQAIVNRNILAALPVEVREMKIDEAKQLGAMALFGEKYGETVRVVSMGEGSETASIEFCGGTHLDNTSKIGLFKILSESSVAAGVRRIEAVTGAGVLNVLDELNGLLLQSAAALKVPNIKELPNRCAVVMDEIKSLEKEKDALLGTVAKAQEKVLTDGAETVGAVRVAAGVLDITPDVLKKMAESIKADHPDVVAVLAGIRGGKGNLCVVCGKSAAAAGVHAGKLAGKIAALTGGRGGGRPDYAMAGIGDVEKAAEAIAAVPDAVREMLK